MVLQDKNTIAVVKVFKLSYGIVQISNMVTLLKLHHDQGALVCEVCTVIHTALWEHKHILSTRAWFNFTLLIKKTTYYG